jgi:hypothetical protein
MRPLAVRAERDARDQRREGLLSGFGIVALLEEPCNGHGPNDLPFSQLDYPNQVRSLNGNLRHTESATLANARAARTEGRDADEVLRKRVDELRRLADRLEQYMGRL